MNVLLTGGTGYIGSHTALVLSQFGHQVTLFDNLSNSKKSVVARIENIIGRSCSFVEGDVCDTALLTATLAEYSIDAVVHFAGLKAVGESSENPIDYYFNNVQGSISLIKAMETQGIRTMVFSSSATVYGSPQQLPLNEEHPTDPANPYGRSKLHIEEMLNDLAQSNQDWRVVCLRYFNPVGAHDSGLIGEQPQGTPNNLMPLITQVAVGQRSELRVFGNDYPTGDGTGVRDYIHVMDLADGHAAALEFLKESSGWHAINLGTGFGHSVLEVIQAFKTVNGCEVPYRFAPRRIGDVPEYYSDPGKAGKLLNWSAKRGLDDMCISALKYQNLVEKVS